MSSDHLIGWSTNSILPKRDKSNYPLAINLFSDIGENYYEDQKRFC